MGKYLRNGQINLDPHRINHIVQVDISTNRIISTNELECQDEPFSFDECINNEILENLLYLCRLPFMSSYRNTSMCDSFEKGLEVYEKYNMDSTDCNIPCYQIDVNVYKNPSRNIFSVVNPYVEIEKKTSFMFLFPTTVTVSEMVENYDFISYFAELGGWSGLFIGVSLLSISFKVTHLLSKIKEKEINMQKKVQHIVTLVSGFMIIFVIYTSFTKFIASNTEQDISLKNDYGNISLSICHEDPIFLNGTYLGQSKEFWVKGSNFSTIIDKIEFIHINGSKEERNESVNSNTKLHNILNSQKYIEFCQTIDLENSVKVVRIRSLKEIFAYIHLNQQLLYRSGKTRITLMPESSISKKGKTAFFSDTNIKIGLVYRKSVRGSKNFFDACMHGRFQNKTNVNIVYPTIDNIEHGVDEKTLNAIKAFTVDGENACQKPDETLTATPEASPYNNRIPMIINDKSTIDLNITGFGYNRPTMYLSLPTLAVNYKVIFQVHSSLLVLLNI